MGNNDEDPSCVSPALEAPESSPVSPGGGHLMNIPSNENLLHSTISCSDSSHQRNDMVPPDHHQNDMVPTDRHQNDCHQNDMIPPDHRQNFMVPHDHQNDMVPNVLNHVGTEQKHEISGDEVRGVLKVIASTGRFWDDWDKLKTMLSFQLKQVLSEYPEAKLTGEEQQHASFGEDFPELVDRLDEALHSFVDGPPFTIQRISEILLDAQTIYPNLRKLALALEKNLLVTSTLTICTDPYPQSTAEELDEKAKASKEPKPTSHSVQNGTEDRDELRTVVQEADVVDDMTIDMEAFN
ncbi:Serine/threonine-protein phosphatase 4 regulatory subunit 2 [Quillaja saponaria]|uniref:Serine/threonine-protein phosphatase 4 regulatory subunit 2 n=1 Tax=Quillaja saponaria TaxID=32244 RepID=A0AAD7L1V3_QUISA|nr:Serine/threonine-protein phosphatase 4 regulatory subunit 2 [Quillaja saponaria]